MQWRIFIYRESCACNMFNKSFISPDHCTLSDSLCLSVSCVLYLSSFVSIIFVPAGQWLDIESHLPVVIQTISPFLPGSSTGCWMDMTTGYVLGSEVKVIRFTWEIITLGFFLSASSAARENVIHYESVLVKEVRLCLYSDSSILSWHRWPILPETLSDGGEEQLTVSGSDPRRHEDGLLLWLVRVKR